MSERIRRSVPVSVLVWLVSGTLLLSTVCNHNGVDDAQDLGAGTSAESRKPTSPIPSPASRETGRETIKRTARE